MRVRGRIAAVVAAVVGLVAALLGPAAVVASADSVRSATAGVGVYSPPEWLPLRGSHLVGCTYNNGCSGGYHGYPAIDFAAGRGEAIYPAGAGKVVEAVSGGVNCPDDTPPFTCAANQYTNYVVIDHGNNVKSRYLHFDTVDVSLNQWVDTNTRLGGAGDSGPSTPGFVHLHYEKLSGGAKVDAGALNVCHGAAPVSYPQAWGFTNWSQVPHHTKTAQSDGTSCGGSSSAGDVQGHLDSAVGQLGGFVDVNGWVLDPDVPTTSTAVHVYFDGPAGSGAVGVAVGAGIERPDVAAAHPGAGSAHGFSAAIPGISPGTHTIYVYGINVGGTPGNNVLFAQQQVTVPNGVTNMPTGNFEDAQGHVGGMASIVGWTFDPDVPTSAISVHVYVDGPPGVGTGPQVAVASQPRPDVAGAYPSAGPNHGFSAFVTGLTPGQHTLFVFAINAAGADANPLLASRTVTVPDGPPADLFHPLSPARILDSRPSGPNVGAFSSPWGPNIQRDVAVAGVGGVPANADAVVLNVTATGTSTSSFLSVWPAGQPKPSPLVSSLNWSSGQTIANAVTAKVGANGKVTIFNPSGNVDVIIDVVGYYDTSAGDGFTSLSPTRILDSRPSGPNVGAFSSPWGPNIQRDVAVAGVGGVPANADAVVLNVTATGTSASSFLSVWPAGQSKPNPLVSSINWVAGQTIPNAVTAKVGANGKVTIFNPSGSVDVIIDVVGYFAAGTGSAFHPLSPARVVDSRPAGPNVGAYSSPWGPNTTRSVAVAGRGGVPATGADAVLANVTVTNTSVPSFLSIWPGGQSKPNPLVSSLNWAAGGTIPNSVTAKLGAGNLNVFNPSGNVDVIADVSGWYG